jgi:hypothetical protein
MPLSIVNVFPFSSWKWVVGAAVVPMVHTPFRVAPAL